MAWIKSIPPLFPKKIQIYKDGTWNAKIGYNNPSPWTWDSNVTLIATTLYSDRIFLPKDTGNARIPLIGTDKAIDLTRYSTLHVKAKGIATAYAGSYGAIGIYSGKYNVNSAVRVATVGVTSTSVQEYTIDITNLSGNYYIAFNSLTFWSFEVYEAWID